jgi:mRNA interferase MazF
MVTRSRSLPVRPSPVLPTPKPPAARRARARDWVPDRQEIIWIDCNPQAGGEMHDLHPMLVLSPGAFNARTGLVIGLPMTTAAYNSSNPFALLAGQASGRKAGQPSYVLCHQPKSFDWQARGARPHGLGRMSDAVFAEACAVLSQIIAIG